MTQLDAPNQQVVRPDGSAPWDEGDGAGEPAAAEGTRKATPKPAPKRGKGSGSDDGDES